MCPPRLAYQVCECTTSAPSTPAAIVRSIDTVRSAARCGADPCSASHASWPTTRGGPSPSPAEPHLWTVTSSSFASSRARYSTWTPAPPYTSGGNSRLRIATFISGLHARALGDDDDAVRGNGEALAVALRVHADLRPGRHGDVLVEDRPAHDRPAADVGALHEDGVLHLAVGVQVRPRREDGAAGHRPGDHDARADHRVHRMAAPALVVEDELRRRQRVRPRVDRPLVVVEVEDRLD